ncbi:MAG: GIY-YIG nuclease family protein [Longimicrobiaceae bacterium]
MSSNDRYFVYILSNASRTLYIGVTNDLVRRVYEHEQKQVPGFTAQYNVTQLVYYEEAAHPQVAIAREKELKGWRRSRKVALVSVQLRREHAIRCYRSFGLRAIEHAEGAAWSASG